MFAKIDDQGCVVNDGSIGKIQPEFRLLVHNSLAVYRSHLGAQLDSVYVRGSVSAGCARLYAADLDMIGVIRAPISQIDISWREQVSRSLTESCPFVTEVELVVASRKDLLRNPEYCGLRVNLKAQSACLWGEDLLPKLPPVRPGRELAQMLYGAIDEEFEWLMAIFRGEATDRTYLGVERPIRFWCVWAMRTLLRAGLAVVMIERPVYSRDLETCKLVFLESYPEYSEDMERAFQWAISPIDDAAALAVFMEDVGPRFTLTLNQALHHH